MIPLLLMVQLAGADAPFVAATPAGPALGANPRVAADGTLTLDTPLGPATLPASQWQLVRRAGAPLPAWPGGAHVVLTSGDRVAGRPLGGDARTLKFAPALDSQAVWDIPLTAVATVWAAPPRADRESERLAPPWAAPKLDTIRSAVGQVSGRLLAFTSSPPGLRFRPEGGANLELPLGQVRAVALDPSFARAPKLRGPALRAVLADGSRLTLADWTTTSELVSGRATSGFQAALPTSQLVALELVSAATELADLKPSGVAAEGYAGGPAPWRAHRSASGGALRLREPAGVSTFDSGLGVPARTRLTYDLPPRAATFVATVGTDPTCARLGSAVVSVELDGKPVVLPKTMTSLDPPLPLRVDVRGCRKLTLVTDFGPAGVGSAANWVGARVWRD